MRIARMMQLWLAIRNGTRYRRARATAWRIVYTDEEPEGPWREPAWMVQGIPRDEAIGFGRTFRQNSIVYCRGARPELIVTDSTLDEIGRTFQGNWRIR